MCERYDIGYYEIRKLYKLCLEDSNKLDPYKACMKKWNCIWLLILHKLLYHIAHILEIIDLEFSCKLHELHVNLRQNLLVNTLQDGISGFCMAIQHPFWTLC